MPRLLVPVGNQDITRRNSVANETHDSRERPAFIRSAVVGTTTSKRQRVIPFDSGIEQWVLGVARVGSIPALQH